MNQAEFIAEKHAAGASIMETIKAVMNEFNVSLGVAKKLVSEHPAWTKVVDAARPLHDELGQFEGDGSIKKP